MMMVAIDAGLLLAEGSEWAVSQRGIKAAVSPGSTTAKNGTYKCIWHGWAGAEGAEGC